MFGLKKRYTIVKETDNKKYIPTQFVFSFWASQLLAVHPLLSLQQGIYHPQSATYSSENHTAIHFRH